MRKRITQREVDTERTYTGNWLCMAMFEGRFRHILYSGYTKREAIRDFVKTLNEEV